jgi:hypothetical protein
MGFLADPFCERGNFGNDSIGMVGNSTWLAENKTQLGLKLAVDNQGNRDKTSRGIITVVRKNQAYKQNVSTCQKQEVTRVIS